MSRIWTVKPPMHGMGINTQDYKGLADGLVGLWPMWTGSGDKAMDVSGFGNHGTLTNMDPATDWIPSEIGPSIDFNAGTEQVIIPRPAQITSTTAMTFSCWAKGNGPGLEAIVSIGDGTRSILIAYLDMALTYSGGVVVQRSPSPPAEIPSEAATAFTPSDWNFYTFVFDGVASNAFIVYVNGVLNHKLLGLALTDVVTDNMAIARGSPGNFGDIQVAQVAIWNRDLHPSEIADLYANPYALITQPDNIALFSAATQGGGAPPTGNRRRRFFMGAA